MDKRTRLAVAARRALCAVCSLALALMLVPAAAFTQAGNTIAEAAEAITTSSELTDGWNQFGTCEWQIDDEGTLTIRPLGNGTSGTLGNTATAFDNPWYWNNSIRSTKIKPGVRGGATLRNMFYGCGSLASIDLSGLDTSGVTDMGHMFCGCGSLASIDLSGLDTSGVTDMEWMFRDCGSLASIDLSGLDTSGVTDMGSMFEYCGSLASIDLSGLDTSGVTDMGYMFFYCGSLASIDLSGLDTSGVTDMENMFCGCNSLEWVPANLVIPSSSRHGGVFYYSGENAPKKTYYSGSDKSILNYDWASNKRELVVVDSGDSGDSSDDTASYYDLANATVSLNGGGAGQFDYEYTGNAITPSVQVTIFPKDETVPTTLTEGTDYTVSYANNTEVGTASVTVTGIGSFHGSKTVTFTIAKTEIDTTGGFTVGRDNNGFKHTSLKDCYLGLLPDITSKYQISIQYWWQLLKIATPLQAALMKAAKNGLYGYNGTCYGISATIAAVYDDLLPLSAITDSNASKFFELNPQNDDTFLNVLRCLFLAQYACEDTVQTVNPSMDATMRPSETENVELDEFLDRVKQLAQSGKTCLFSYGYEDYGHTLVLLGDTYLENEDGSWSVKVYDPNSLNAYAKGILEDLIVNKDGTFNLLCTSTPDMDQTNYVYMQVMDIENNEDFTSLAASIRSMNSSSTSSLSTSSLSASSLSTRTIGSDRVELSIPFDGDTQITNTAGKTLTLSGGKLSGDMNVYDIDFTGEDNVRVVVTTDRSEFTVTATSGSMDVQLTDDEDLLSVNAGNVSKATLSLASGATINAAGTCDFSVWSTIDDEVAEGEPGLVSIGGKLTGGTASVKKESDKLVLDSDTPASSIEATSYIGAESYSLVESGEGKTIEIGYEDVVNPGDSGDGDSGDDDSSGENTYTFAKDTLYVEGGSFTVSPLSMKEGDTVTITPNPDKYYECKTVSVRSEDGNSVTVRKNGDGTYSFVHPGQCVSVSVVFVQKYTDVKCKLVFKGGKTLKIKAGKSKRIDVYATRASNGKGKWKNCIYCEKVGGSKYLSVTENGKIKVSKKAKRGKTYKIKVRADFKSWVGYTLVGVGPVKFDGNSKAKTFKVKVK